MLITTNKVSSLGRTSGIHTVVLIYARVLFFIYASIGVFIFMYILVREYIGLRLV